MKILQINKLYHPVIGGIETIVKEISEDLNGKNDLEIDVLACQEKGPQKEEIINGIKVYKAASYGKKLGMPLSLDFFKLLFSIENNYDALFFHFPFPLAALAIPFLKNKNIIILYHSDIVRQKISRLFFLPFILKSLELSRIIVTSSKNLATNSRYLKRFSSKISVIPFGIEPNKFNLTNGLKEESTKIRSLYDGPILLSVGRLVYYKGFEYLIRSMKQVEASLLIIGSGPLKEKLEAMIKSLGLSKKVTIIDHVSDLRPYYAASDIFIFPSIASSEAFGLVQLEAMAFSRPVINTSLSTGVPEVSVDGISGITVPPKDSLSLANAINKLLISPGILKKYGQAARQRILEIFNKKEFNQKLTEMFFDNFSSTKK